MSRLVSEAVVSDKAPALISSAALAAFVHRPGDRDIHGPSSRYALPESGRRDAVGPRLVPPQFSVRGPGNVGSVDALQLVRNPGAVTGLVISVDVNSLDGEIVSIPGSKRPFLENTEIGPLGADRYPPSAIVTEAGIALIATPAAHALPCLIEAVARGPVDSAHIADALGSGAATGCIFAGSKICSDDIPGSSAIADARPDRSAALRVPGLTQNIPPTEALAAQVDFPWVRSHSIPSNEFCHNSRGRENVKI